MFHLNATDNLYNNSLGSVDANWEVWLTKLSHKTSKISKGG